MDELNEDIEYLRARVKELNIQHANYLVERLAGRKAKARKCWCGADSGTLIEKHDPERDKYRIICSKCQARTKYYRDSGHAWYMWNERVLSVH